MSENSTISLCRSRSGREIRPLCDNYIPNTLLMRLPTTVTGKAGAVNPCAVLRNCRFYVVILVCGMVNHFIYCNYSPEEIRVKLRRDEHTKYVRSSEQR